MLFGISFMRFILISFRLFKLTICISKIFVIERFSFRVSPVSGGFQITLKRNVIKKNIRRKGCFLNASNYFHEVLSHNMIFYCKEYQPYLAQHLNF
ncbi:hypothetical protein BFV64_07665 [Enterobacter kobei]|nr:hypothetical protein BFV64_07665 [Enterobacter kobei]